MYPRRRCLFGGRAVLGLFLVAIAVPASAIPVARDGSPLVPIVIPDSPDPPERTAAEELALYLGSVVGSPFEILPESAPEALGAAIHVGPTAFARSVFPDLGELGPEEWRIRTEEGNLVIVGGRPRGTLYAVSRFLEEVVGIRWWTPRDETVPGRPGLRSGPLDLRGAPAFAYRDLFGLDGPPVFRLHLRLNGSDTRLDTAWGGRIAYGMHGVHSFEILLPPDEFFPMHPEYFSFRGGFRTAERSQLCMTHEGIDGVLADRILKIAREARSRARDRGEPLPELFDLSPNDWDGRCQCDRCRRAAETHGGESGPLLDLVNRVAALVRREEPDLRLTTLAYTWTSSPPTSPVPGPGVIVRWSGYGIRDPIRPLSDPGNDRSRNWLEEWAELAPDLWVWDYGITYHDRFGLPLPNLRTFGPDLRAYRDFGVDGLYVQFDFPLGGEMHDLKVWVLAKLLEDPDRDPGGLIREFTNGFYGPAGRRIRSYLRLTERAADRTGTRLTADAVPLDYGWLDDEFLSRATSLFDKAEKSVRHDPVLTQRVRWARTALDWAVLRFGTPEHFDRASVISRLRRSWEEQAILRLTPPKREVVLERIRDVFPEERKSGP
jgi:hypothetical protein